MGTERVGSNTDSPTDGFGTRCGRALKRRDLGVAIILFVSSFAVLWATATMGFTRDESFYFKYAGIYQDWFTRVAQDQSEMEPIDRALARDDTVASWGQNFEHPPLMKMLFGFSWRLFANKHRPMENVRHVKDGPRAGIGRLTPADGFEIGDTVVVYAPIEVGQAPEDASRLVEATVIERTAGHAIVELTPAAAETLESACVQPKSSDPMPVSGCRAASSGNLQFMRESQALRLPAWVFSAALIALIYLFGVELFGAWAGLFAAIAFFVVPRQFFHAHLCSFDMPVTTLVFATVYAFWKSLRSRRWVAITALLWGVGLLTKLNAFFIPIPLIAAWLFPDALEAARRRLAKREWKPRPKSLLILAAWTAIVVVTAAFAGKGPAVAVALVAIGSASLAVRLPPMPRAFLVMPPVGLVMLFALWPQLWYDPARTFYDYVNFHLSHVHYLQQYYGHILSAPPFPLAFPFAMTALTVPISILFMMAVGTVTVFIIERKQVSVFIRVLLAANILFPIVLIALPSTPIFGGIKHWMATVAFGCLVAGHGFDWMRRRGLGMLSSGTQRVVAVIVAALILTPGAIASVRHVDVGTSYYNEISGGLPGAADDRMQRQFWGYGVMFALDYINKHAARNATVGFHNATHDAYQFYQRDGLLRQDIRWTRNPSGPCRPGRDLYVFHHQESFAQDLIEVRASLGKGGKPTIAPLKVYRFDGVPIVSIYGCLDEDKPEDKPE
ncbi:MAG: hypothetical protein ACI9OJ_000837 [Myxococcota bacterium]